MDIKELLYLMLVLRQGDGQGGGREWKSSLTATSTPGPEPGQTDEGFA
jgi:hypothetical protein